jgi:hypothetical protein
MLKHYNETEIKSMAKTLEEAKNMSNKNLQKKSNTTTKNKEGPITRSRAKELEKQKELNFYSEVVKKYTQKYKLSKSARCT